ASVADRRTGIKAATRSGFADCQGTLRGHRRPFLDNRHAGVRSPAPPRPAAGDARLRDDAGARLRVLRRRAFCLRTAQVLVKPRHDLDEIAGPVAVVELMHEDVVPGILAGAG